MLLYLHERCWQCYERECSPPFICSVGWCPSLFPLLPKPLLCLGCLSPSSSWKQVGFFQNLITMVPAERLVSLPTARQPKMLFASFSWKTRKYLGWFQINYLKFELGILTYSYIPFPKSPVSQIKYPSFGSFSKIRRNVLKLFLGGKKSSMKNVYLKSFWETVSCNHVSLWST